MSATIFVPRYGVTYFLAVSATAGRIRSLKTLGHIPFLPYKGMKIRALPGDEYRFVELVRWSCDAPILEVYLQDESSIKPIKPLIMRGWIYAD